MNEIHIVYVTSYGDCWENTEKHVVNSIEEVDYYRSEEYKKEKESIGGVECISVDVMENVDEKQLRQRLTVEEYCELFPDIKNLIDSYFNK